MDAAAVYARRRREAAAPVSICAAHASLETLQNCTKEALALYKQVDTFKPRPDAKVAIWYGSREPNMKKAVQKIKRAFPNAEEHPFEGYGHGDIIGCPDVMAEQIERFMSQNVR